MVEHRETMTFIVLLIILDCLLGVRTHEYCIIGAGPSGLQMGYFLQRSGRDYVIYERHSAPGWFYTVFPRHRTLISINKRHTGKRNKEFNLRHDWNSLLSDRGDLLMTKYSKEFFPKADTMVRYLKDYAEKLKLNIQYNTNIEHVNKTADQSYKLFDSREKEHTCKYLIVSTGLWVENVPDELNGVEHTIGYPHMFTHRDYYEGRTILILGRGNSAFETAQHLLPSANLIHMLSRSRLKFSWETHYVGDVRAVNCGPIDTYQLKSLDGQLDGRLDHFILQKRNKKIFVTFNDSVDAVVPQNLPTREGYDVVIRALGFNFDSTIFSEDIRPEASEVGDKYPRITANYEFTSSPNVFVTGTATHSLDHRKSAGGFIHGFRYTTRALARHLEWRNHGVPWPHATLHINDLMNYLLRRLNEASDIYQMFTALCDVIVFRENDQFEYFQGVPYGMLTEFEKHTGASFSRGIVVNMEYGKNFSGPGKDPFRKNRATGEAQQAHKSNFLHPVLYYYDDKIPPLVDKFTLPRPTRVHHMVEDFLTTWVAPLEHVMPLRWFLEYCTSRDLRNFYAEDCFKFAMTGTTAPVSCEKVLLLLHK